MDELHRLSVEDYRRSDKTPLVVVLDNIRSHNNVGSLFRTADAFRAQRLCLCGITAQPPHRDIHKTALGAEEAVEWRYYEDTAACLRELRGEGYDIFAVEQVDDSANMAQWRWQGQGRGLALVLGNEIEGVGQDLLPLCDGALEIPQFGTKHSLNVSCAGAIAMWEAFKRLAM